MNLKKQFIEGLITQNPALVQLLGMCPLLAITTSMFNGIGMGAAVIIILTCSNVVISALRKVIPSKVRIACYIVVIAGFVTMVDLLLKAFIPALSKSSLSAAVRGAMSRSPVLSPADKHKKQLSATDRAESQSAFRNCPAGTVAPAIPPLP